MFPWQSNFAVYPFSAVRIAVYMLKQDLPVSFLC